MERNTRWYICKNRSYILGFRKFLLKPSGIKKQLLKTSVCIMFSLILLNIITSILDKNPYPYNRFKGYPLSTCDHPYKINTDGTCSGNFTLDMVIVIHSKASNFRKRTVIRQTWANRHLLSNYNMRLLFFLGMPSHQDFQVTIQHESFEHNDIVQGTFHDSYTNLTHKAVLWIRWVKEYCPNAAYILKLDDDVLVNLFSLYHIFIPKYRIESKKMWCHKLPAGTTRISRQRTETHMVASDELKGLTFYPFTTCRGYFVILTQDSIVPLYKAVGETPFFWIDDYYVFGELAHAANIQHDSLLDNLLFLGKENTAYECFKSRKQACTLFGVLLKTENAMKKLWNRIKNHFGMSYRYNM